MLSSRCHDDVGLQLPGLGGHRAEPVVEEGDEAHLRDAVRPAVGLVVGVGHCQQVVVVGVRRAAVVIAYADRPVAAPKVPADHNGMPLLQLPAEEARRFVVSGKLWRRVANGLNANADGVVEQGRGDVGTVARGDDVKILAAVEIAVNLFDAGAVVRQHHGRPRLGTGRAAVDVGVHLRGPRLLALGVGAVVAHHHLRRRASAGVVGALLQGGEARQRHRIVALVAVAARQHQQGQYQ